MKRNSIILAISITLAALSAAVAIFGATETIGQTNMSTRKNWMAKLPDNTLIKDLSVPGSHDTAALYGIADLAGQCQSLDVKEQLHLGIRALDIRLKQSGQELRAVHGFIDQKQSFHSVSNVITEFLKENPSETLFVSIKREADPSSPKGSFEDCLKEQINEDYWLLNKTMPTTLGEARGKAILLARYEHPTIGVNLGPQLWSVSGSFGTGDFFIQDEYLVQDIEAKKTAIRACFDSDKPYRLNFFSGYKVNSFPPSYAPSVAYEINEWAKTYLPSNPHVGISFFDFVTTSLLDAFFGGKT